MAVYTKVCRLSQKYIITNVRDGRHGTDPPLTPQSEMPTFIARPFHANHNSTVKPFLKIVIISAFIKPIS